MILAECVHVLRSHYGLGAPAVAGLMRSVLGFPAVRVADRGLLSEALGVYGEGRLDFADAYLGAAARRSGVGAVVSFDRDLDGMPAIERIEP